MPITTKNITTATVMSTIVLSTLLPPDGGADGGRGDGGRGGDWGGIVRKIKKEKLRYRNQASLFLSSQRKLGSRFSLEGMQEGLDPSFSAEGRSASGGRWDDNRDERFSLGDIHPIFFI